MPRFGWLPGLVLLVSLAGCSTRPVTVKGKVLKNGAPLATSKTGVVQVTLVPVDPKTSSSNKVGRARPDGSFEVEEVPVGKYRIGIELFDPTPRTDKLGGAFSPGTTKIIRDVDGKKPIEVDLDKPES